MPKKTNVPRMFDDRILVKHVPPKELTEGGILLPDTSKPPFMQSHVVAVGPGPIVPTTAERRPLDVKVGDLVAHYSQGTQFEIDGEKLNVLRESDIIAVL